jgi:hypothetical protein
MTKTTPKKKPAGKKAPPVTPVKHIIPKQDLVIMTAPPQPLPEATTSNFFTSPQVDKIFAALSKAQATVKAAKRTQAARDENGEEYFYADLFDVMEATNEAAGDNDLAVIERFPPGKLTLHCILVHGSGQWIDYGCYDFGKFETHQEKGSAVTYARRHVRQCIFGVSTKGQDDDGKSGNKPLTGETEAPTTSSDDGLKGYNAAKNKWHIEPTITNDGRIDFDEFALLYEQILEKVKTMSDLSLLGKANNITLNKMEEDRPDLYNYIQDAINPIAQKLL